MLLCQSARADSVADEADFRFRRGATLYRERRFEDALSEFLASNRLVRNRNVLFNIARCFELLDQFNAAYRWYTDILGEPGLSATDRPEITSALERLRPSVALLRIESDPPGASVFVDRKDLGERGQTPLTLALPPGKATALLELAGYKPAQRTATLVIGKSALVRISLERIYGALEASGSPFHFELREDDTASAPILVESGTARVLPGRHLLYASARGFVPQQLEVEVPPEGTAKVSFNLVPVPPPSGAVVVRASLEGALERIDGKEVGFTPDVIEGIAAGRHTVEVLGEGREAWVRSVEVKENDRSFLDAKLRYAAPRVSAAERRLTSVEDAPASVTLISADEIRGFGYTTLADALRSVRGFTVSDDGSYQSLGVRGFGAPGTNDNKVLVLFDGHVTNDLSLGQGFVGHEFDIDLSDVDHIEIVRGPGSVLYGSAAFFAVVNVVHKTPVNGTHVSGFSQVNTLGGTLGSAVASTGGKSGSLALRAGGLFADGEPIIAFPTAAGPATAFASGVDIERAGHADLHGRLGDFTLVSSFNSRRKGVPTGAFDTVFGLPGTEDSDQRFFTELSFNHTFDSGFGIDARGSYDLSRATDTRQYRGVGTDGHPDALGHTGMATHGADSGNGELRLRLPTILGNSLFFGGEAVDLWNVTLTSFTPASSNAGFGNTAGTYSESVVSAYAGDDVRLGSRVQLKAAVRVDDHLDSFGLAIDPRLALIFQPYEGGNTKLLYGTAFRAPSMYERHFADGTTQVQATDLQPERVTSGEFEHTHQFGGDFSLLLAGYWSKIDNLIRLKQLSHTRQFAFANRSTLVHSSGAETELRWQPSPGALVAFWYSFAHVTDDNGHIVPNSPSHSGSVRVLYPIVPAVLSLSTEATYGSGRFTATDAANPEQLVGQTVYWNAGLSGEYARLGLRYGAFVENLLDEHPLDPAGLEVPFPGHAVPQAGRTMRFQLGGSF